MQRIMGLSIQKFFKWLAFADLSPQVRRPLPKEQQFAVMSGLVLLRKKGSTSPVKAKDIWNDGDAAISNTATMTLV